MANTNTVKVMSEKNLQHVTASQRITKGLVYFFLYLFCIMQHKFSQKYTKTNVI